jgi:4-amino-4-deoxy-L-arabinose transferase-like glycosyltransferase
MIKKNLFFNFKYLLPGILIIFPLFLGLTSFPVLRYDEARLAVNALEMSENGNWIVTQFDGKPEMWNTKPPLMIWLQVIFLKILGTGELALRLPSVIAAFLTAIVIMVFLDKYLKEYWLGVIAVTILVTSPGYISIHGARTGDYDALLTLFTTLYCLLFFSFIETKKIKFLYLFFIAVTLAVLTKSIAGLLFLPALLLYSIWQKQVFSLLKIKQFYFGLALFLVTVPGYYLLREAMNPGYLAAVNTNELGGRYLTTIESHDHEFLYYFHNFVKNRFKTWLLLVPAGLIIGITGKAEKLTRLSTFLIMLLVSYLLVISTAKTKLEWYDMPMYPFMAIAAAFFIYPVFSVLKENERINTVLKFNFLPYFFLVICFIIPYYRIIRGNYSPYQIYKHLDMYNISFLLKDALAGKEDLNDFYLLQKGHYSQNLFYLKALQQKGVRISLKDWRNLEPGDRVIYFTRNLTETDVADYLKNSYKLELIKKRENILMYKIEGRKIWMKKTK